MVNIVPEKDIPVTAPAQSIHRSHRLEDLVAEIPGNYRAGEVEWGRPEGSEVW